MKNLMRKELVLAMHPASVLFLLLSAMLLIPNYPYYVICFYTCLGTFFICLTGRENRDIEFTALLPVRKTDLVRARVFTVMLMQLAQLVIAVPFAVFRPAARTALPRGCPRGAHHRDLPSRFTSREGG